VCERDFLTRKGIMIKTQSEWYDIIKNTSEHRQLLTYNQKLQDKEITCKIIKTNETGEMVYAIVVSNDYWMDAFKKKKEAVNLCNVMGWNRI
jgi:hypothetical protein